MLQAEIKQRVKGQSYRCAFERGMEMMSGQYDKTARCTALKHQTNHCCGRKGGYRYLSSTATLIGDHGIKGMIDDNAIVVN